MPFVFVYFVFSNIHSCCCSVREPTQVFTLLETVYRAFDILARKKKVFKIETVGDCYVAVTGLPEPRYVDDVFVVVVG